MKYFDFHSHYIPPEIAQKTAFFQVGWSDIHKQLKIMDQCLIEKSILLYPTTDAHLQMGGWAKVCRLYNDYLLQIQKKYADRFLAGAIIPPDHASELTRELKEIEQCDFSLISLASSYQGKYLDDEYFYPVYEFARRRKLAIHIHPQILRPIGEERLQDPLLSPVLEYVFDVSACIGRMMMQGTFIRFPDVRFIFAHYGGVLPFVKERFDSTYLMLRQRGFVKDLNKLPSEYFKNLYFDISGSKSPASLLCALELTDERHILWGSDYPANQGLQESIHTILQNGLSDEQKLSILSSNASDLLSVIAESK